jgi:putative transcriptional regulator
MGKNDFDSLLADLSEALAEPVAGTSRPDPAPPSRPSIPDRIDVAAIRRRTGLSQPTFAARIGVPVATLRNWEQGHRSPQGPARVLLALLDRNPRIVLETLEG